jgi:hypothetical protein
LSREGRPVATIGVSNPEHLLTKKVVRDVLEKKVIKSGFRNLTTVRF